MEGYSEMWLQGPNDWVYRHLHKASERMTELAEAHPAQTNGLNRARSTRRCGSCSWRKVPTGRLSWAPARTPSMPCGAPRTICCGSRTSTNRFAPTSIDEPWLRDIEAQDNIFPEIDYRVHR